jgi:ribonuclease Z
VSNVNVIFLGTNGWYDTATGNTICILIDTGADYLLLDAGNGIYKFNEYARAPKPAYLFLSHFHLDHIEGLHTLAKLHFTAGLKIIAQKGSRDILDTFVNKPFTLAFSDLPYPVEIQETEEGTVDLPFPARALFLHHSSPTMGFRFILGGKVITYCPDTGYCENALKLAERADLLIAECAYLSGEERPDWPHLNPESAARLAREAGAKQLALVHFDADRYRSFSDRNRARTAARKIFPRVIAAKDGLEMMI